MLLLLPLVVIFGCTRDTTDDESVILKRANVPIPCKGVVCMIEKEGVDRLPVFFPDTEKPVPGVTLSSEAWLYGHMAFVGNIREESAMTGLVAYLDMDAYAEGRIVLTADYVGRMYSANGDYFDFFSPIVIEIIDGEKHITGTVTITSGCGKFENATGTSTLSGIVPCWDVVGKWEFSR